MLFLILLLCVSWNFLLITAEDHDNITIIMTTGKDCSLQPTYTLTEGHDVSFHIEWPMNDTKTIKHAGWKHRDTESYVYFKNSHKMVAKKYIEGIWMFEFLYLKDIKDNIDKSRFTTYEGHNYTRAQCSTNVTIEPAEYVDIKTVHRYFIIMIAEGVIGVTIIGAQAAYIIYLRSKARKLNRHNNLSKKTEHTEVDTTRYCSDPGKKVVKSAPINEINRESIIYEAPNIELPDRLPIIQPPQPPAISTMPRTPRSDQQSKIATQNMLTAALNRPGRGPDTKHHSVPRRKKIERDVNLANRPPLPLPLHDENNQEVYEEMETDENTYESPPVVNTLPPRLSVLKKTAKVLDIQREPQKLRCVSKPAVTQKPNSIPPKNELEQVFRRRNNVMQVPIVSIPDHGSSGTTPPKPRPPPVAKPMPRGPHISPAHQPVSEETYYTFSNEKQDSSDEEWTYEPLKPLNSYNNMNIYNI